MNMIKTTAAPYVGTNGTKRLCALLLQATACMYDRGLQLARESVNYSGPFSYEPAEQNNGSNRRLIKEPTIPSVMKAYLMNLLDYGDYGD